MSRGVSRGFLLTKPLKLGVGFTYASREVVEKEIQRLLEFDCYKLYPSTICNLCAGRGRLKIQRSLATFYKATCSVCSKEEVCTESRDYGYPEIRIYNNTLKNKETI